MPDFATLLPTRRPELLVSPLGDNGQSVVKDPGTGAYFHLGEQESFLLGQLDGKQAAAVICASFEQRFCQPLSVEDLREFIELARSRRLLEPPKTPGTTGGATPSGLDAPASR